MHKRLRIVSVATLSVITLGALALVSQEVIDWPTVESAATHAASMDDGIDWPPAESALISANAGNGDIDWP